MVSENLYGCSIRTKSRVVLLLFLQLILFYAVVCTKVRGLRV